MYQVFASGPKGYEASGFPWHSEGTGVPQVVDPGPRRKLRGGTAVPPAMPGLEGDLFRAYKKVLRQGQ
ncbi:MAG: hypothetical protein CME16_05240 [Gemmatimonadetes bacterium]|nr:hypothetical protein [Gemmatimonadota bacterium]